MRFVCRYSPLCIFLFSFSYVRSCVCFICKDTLAMLCLCVSPFWGSCFGTRRSGRIRSQVFVRYFDIQTQNLPNPRFVSVFAVSLFDRGNDLPPYLPRLISGWGGTDFLPSVVGTEDTSPPDPSYLLWTVRPGPWRTSSVLTGPLIRGWHFRSRRGSEVPSVCLCSSYSDVSPLTRLSLFLRFLLTYSLFKNFGVSFVQ